MKTNRYFLSLLLLVLAEFAVFSIQAQTVGEVLYIYRNDGQFNAFFCEEVDSIAYSCYDADGVSYEEIVTQLVYTEDSLYRIPIAAIDSVSFVQPETKVKPDVMCMKEDWLPYILSVEDNTITFRATTPTDYLPVIGQVLMTETFEEPFTLGFSGRVTRKDLYSDRIVFTVEEVSLSDIYDHLVSVGVSSSYDENEAKPDRPKLVWAENSNKGVKFPLPNFEVELGPVTLSCSPSIVMKYIICVGEPNLKDYVDITVRHTYRGTASIDVKREAEYNPEPKWVLSVPINTSIPGLLYGKIRLGGFVRTSGSVNLSATQPFVISGVSGFVKAEGKPSQRTNSWTASLEGLEAELNLDGTFHTGVAAQLLFGIVHEKVASADITAYIGPKLSAHFSLSADGLVSRTLYSSLKNSEVNLKFTTEVIPGYRFWGSDEHLEAPVKLSWDKDINHWYVVPEFSELTYKSQGKSGILNGNISRNLLPKVSLGWAVYDDQDQIYDKYYFNQTYRKIGDWPNKGLQYKLSDLPSGGSYKAYPLVKLFGTEMRGDEGVAISTDFPVTLSDFEVTKSQYKKDGFSNDGKTYDYRFDVSVTATLDEETAKNVADWGYVYRDLNGQEKEISLRQFGTSKTDDRYAYYRNQPKSTCTLFGFVKYADSSEAFYGDPIEFELNHSETFCPDGNHPHMIDLGLPSGTKWACCNVGATKPEEYGDYFAWGETKGYKSGKRDFSWSTYKWCNGASNTQTKYCNDSDYGNNGFTDNKTELDLEDDAAYVNWGSNWRMPSKGQQDELRSQCTWIWTQLNGVNGYRVTSKTNGNSIFLPAAGYRYGASLSYAGSGGDCWSRTLSTDSPDGAYGLSFNSGFVDWYYSYGRSFGFSVRPVRR